MDIYITFYEIDKNIIFVNNGFSFGRNKESCDIDLFFNSNSNDKITKLLLEYSIKKYKASKIWVSLSYTKEAELIHNITDDKWIIGGPLVVLNKNFKEFNNFFNGNPKLVYTTMEEYLGKEISSDFDPYFINYFEKNYINNMIIYSMSLDLRNCYWHKCKFCDCSVTKNFINGFRKDIKKIISSSIKNNKNNKYYCDLCSFSITESILKEILENNFNKNIFFYFVRADVEILNVIKMHDLSGQIFSIGVEGFSQEIMNEMNKGIKIETVLELTEEILKRNGSIRYMLMFNYTFLTRKIVNDYKENFRKIIEIHKKYNKKFDSKIERYVLWSDKFKAEKSGFLSRTIKCNKWESDSYISIIPKDCEQDKFNNELLEIINKGEKNE